MKTTKILLAAFSAIVLCMPLYAQKDAKTKKILDETAKRINSAASIEADFKIMSFVGSSEQGAGIGKIQLKGKKYKLDLMGQDSWFDGKTLWNYNADINEVNVSNPTKKEIQAMNPYSFVTLYKKGYNYTCQTNTYNGKQMYDVKLKAEKGSTDIPEILITISKDYIPKCIRMRQGRNWTRITITSFSTSKSFSDNMFVFPTDKYNDVDIIDMR